MTNESNPLLKLSPAEQAMTREQLADLSEKNQTLRIGIPRETLYDEQRVPLAPESVSMLVQMGHSVLVEQDAGQGAGFPDIEFAEAGATICQATDEIFNSDVVLKVTPPTAEEIEMLANRKLLISALHFCGRDKAYFQSLMKKRSTAIGYENIRDKTGRFPVIQSISEIVGAGSIFIAANLLSDPVYGKGTILGGFPGITPVEVVIIGAGTVATSAAKTAINLGAIVKVFDNNIYKLRSISAEPGCALFTSIIQPKVLHKALKTADVVIGALRAEEGHMPYIVPEEMVQSMKPGAVIIDVSIDQGGGFETSVQTSHKNPVYLKHGIAHYAVPNIASKYARTSSYALSNYFHATACKAGRLCKSEPVHSE
jgi:alanine dehydrogenase